MADTADRVVVRRVAAWALYDVATSSYFAVIPTVLFPLYYRAHLDGGRLADLHWGLLAAGALLVSGLGAPILGAHIDSARRGDRRYWALVTLTALTIGATAAMAELGPGALLPAAAVFIAAQSGYMLAMALYDSYLPDLAPGAAIGRVSGFGWAIGFAGGIAALVLVRARLRGAVDLPPIADFQASFRAVAGLFLALAVVALGGLRAIPGRGGASPAPPGAGSRPRVRALAAAWTTLLRWRDEPALFRFLIASYLINQGIVTVLFFAAIFFQRTRGLSLDGILQLWLVYHVLAVPGTLVFGWLADLTSHRRALLIAIALWIAATLLLVLARAAWALPAAVVLFALAFGSTQALLRSHLARLVPVARAAEFFGFNALAGRVSAAVGPALFGGIAAATGSQRAAMLSVLAFFLAGAVALRGTPERRRRSGAPV